MTVHARKTTMELNPVLAPHALTILLDLVEIPSEPRAGAMLTTSAMPRSVPAEDALMAHLLLKQLLAEQPPRVQTALAKTTTTLLELPAHATLVQLVIYQPLDR